MNKWLLRRGVTYSQGQRWRSRHMEWLRGLRFDDPIEQAVFDDYLQSLEQVAERMKNLDEQLQAVAELPQYSAAVAALRCFHGIDTVSAVVWVAELYAFERFDSPRGLSSEAGSRRRATHWCGGSSSKQPGTTGIGPWPVQR
jgi:transposase